MYSKYYWDMISLESVNQILGFHGFSPSQLKCWASEPPPLLISLGLPHLGHDPNGSNVPSLIVTIVDISMISHKNIPMPMKTSLLDLKPNPNKNAWILVNDM